MQRVTAQAQAAVARCGGAMATRDGAAHAPSAATGPGSLVSTARAQTCELGTREVVRRAAMRCSA